MSEQVTIIGAGIVGVCCGLWAQSKGFTVEIIDPNPPGSVTSFGNACTFADYACIPVNNPSIISGLPRLLFDKNSPLGVDFGYALTHLGWMLKFLNHCRQSNVTKTIEQLSRILQHTQSGLMPLIEASQSQHLLQANGCMYGYQTKQGFDKARTSNQMRKNQGVNFEELNGEEIAEQHPELKLPFYRGLLFSDARQTINPKSLVDNLFDHFIRSGGTYRQQRVTKLMDHQGKVKIFLDDSQTIHSDKSVLAAGAFSNQIKVTGAKKLPLDTERGYHVQYRDKQWMAPRPIAWAESGLYAVPTDNGLRFAGTVEIAGLEKPMNNNRINYIRHKASEMFGIEEEPDQTWLGYRPTMPDALPVIGPATTANNIFYAFGHQHIGLTLSGITGKLIGELMTGETTSIDISGFSPNRF